MDYVQQENPYMVLQEKEGVHERLRRAESMTLLGCTWLVSWNFGNCLRSAYISAVHAQDQDQNMLLLWHLLDWVLWACIFGWSVLVTMLLQTKICRFTDASRLARLAMEPLAVFIFYKCWTWTPREGVRYENDKVISTLSGSVLEDLCLICGCWCLHTLPSQWLNTEPCIFCYDFP